MGVKETFLELKQAWINSRGEEREKAERAMDAFRIRFLRMIILNFRKPFQKILNVYIVKLLT